MGEPDNRALLRWVRHALRHLYDPPALLANPLCRTLGGPEASPVLLRTALVAAIDALKPVASVSPQSHAWRTYHVLVQRYVQQFSQSEVATDLGLSVRQLQRQERTALGELAGRLAMADEVRAIAQSAARGAPGRGEDGSATGRERELAWLETFPNQPVQLEQVLRATLSVAQTLLQATDVRVVCELPERLPCLDAKAASLRQALLNLLTAGARRVPGGRLTITAGAQGEEVRLDVAAEPAAGGPALASATDTEELEMALELVALSGGRLEVQAAERGAPFAARVRLPVAQCITVLVIDDNADTLQLYERYLAGSPYAFYGVRDPEQALQAADRLEPRLILLDVMLPGRDGWELLGWLRERPSVRGRPIVVCTILPQEPIALSLGAAAFLRKPFSRQELLALLARLTAAGPAGGSKP
ncbi:MAG: response regulator [Chloroflexi bacterium]|nr:response regulator [Chloroflexota bacterium]